jgi:PAS domain S-box-containing protein
METLLAESEERYRVLFERSSEAIFIEEPEGDILTANPATAELFGVNAAELKHLNITDFYQNPDDRIAFRREVESKGFVKDYPLQMKRKDGTEKLCMLSSSLWKDREGAIIGYLSMLLDVTEHRRLEEQLRQAQKMESIGTLAGGVAHDFNNILTIIQGYSEMVLMDKSQDHPDYADLAAVYDAAKRGADLVKQLMTFSRKVETDMRPVNLNKEVQTAVKLLSRTIPKMIDVQMRLAPDTRRIKADSGQIEQVILNLAVNAKHAMPDGGTLTIETGNIMLDDAYCKTHAEATPGDYVYLTIEDTGHGIPKDVVDRIFEPFFSTKKQGEGTGLGLAMVYGIVKHHGGHIMCYSEPGVGTAFKIYLPVIEDLAISGEFKILPEAPGGSETVLLVDDEEMIRSLGRKMLEQAGYRVLEALTGEEAVEIYRNEGSRIDLVVLDLIMPGMGGRQALAELKNMDPDVRVVIASGYSPDGLAESATETGAAGFITKPFRRHDVLRTVREVLDR